MTSAITNAITSATTQRQDDHHRLHRPRSAAAGCAPARWRRCGHATAAGHGSHAPPPGRWQDQATDPHHRVTRRAAGHPHGHAFAAAFDLATNVADQAGRDHRAAQAQQELLVLLDPAGLAGPDPVHRRAAGAAVERGGAVSAPANGCQSPRRRTLQRLPGGSARQKSWAQVRASNQRPLPGGVASSQATTIGSGRRGSPKGTPAASKRTTTWRTAASEANSSNTNARTRASTCVPPLHCPARQVQPFTAGRPAGPAATGPFCRARGAARPAPRRPWCGRPTPCRRWASARA